VYADYTPWFTPSDVSVISNGYCGSSCAIVAATLQDYHGVPTVYLASRALTNDTSTPMFTFAGGQVLTSKYIFEFVKRLQVPGLPTSFPTASDLSFTFRNIYGRHSKFPLEFINIPADFVVPVTARNAMRLPNLWHDAAVVLGWGNKTAIEEKCDRQVERINKIRHNNMKMKQGLLDMKHGDIKGFFSKVGKYAKGFFSKKYFSTYMSRLNVGRENAKMTDCQSGDVIKLVAILVPRAKDVSWSGSNDKFEQDDMYLERQEDDRMRMQAEQGH